MHISEGILSAPVLAGGAAAAAVGLAVGLKAVREQDIPKAAVLAAVFFVSSLIHVKIGPSSAHLMLSGLMGLFLGRAAFPVIFAGLLLQGILFQFGGLTVLGVNTFNLAAPAVLLAWLLRPAVNSSRRPLSVAAAFVCGAGSTCLSALLAALCLWLTGHHFKFVALELLAANIPIVIVEGLICVVVVTFLIKVRPRLLWAPSAGAAQDEREQKL